MSILIKGVTLKDFKPFCPCLNGEYGDCDIPGIKRCYGIGKDGCPLVEIPPHGRLIDADALLERFEKEEKAADEHGRDFSFSFKSGGENCTEWWPVQQMLMDAPTIIPADKEGET